MSDSSAPESVGDCDAAESLRAIAAQFGVDVAIEQAAALSRYCQLLWQWNAQLNLTRHTTTELFVTRDLIDSVELAKEIPNGASVLDVGSGGGVPGVVLAILRRDLQVSLCESTQKKARALQDIVTSLLLGVPVFAERAEAVLADHHFSHVTVRAVSSISSLLTWFEPVRASFGELLLIKGPRWVEERADADAAGLLRRKRCEVVSTWRTPGRDHESVLLRITPK